MPGRHLIAIALFGAFSLLAVPAQSQSAGAKGAVDGDLISIESMREMFQNGDPGNKHFCAIVVTQPGSLAASPDNMELSSRQAGGRPGIAQITATNSSFDLTIDPPSGFNLAPSGGATDTSFASTISATGSTSFAEASGAFPMDIKRGVSQIEANFVATRNGSPFPAGQYSAELVLRCE
jgi:hypothetical protein